MTTYGKEKNELLKENRGIGFEEIIAAIDAGKVLDVYDHPDQENYPGQKIYIVEALDYIYLVPFVRNEEGIFLKTIIPSRKAKKIYKGDNNV
ncbi:MAG TPA: toxin [Sulfuricurvum sp.]|nr:MAG: toxin [Campylobacterales bacterium 16-40-21]OZA02213.1 MAG: toxin [Sulfuricurvum sp. 17-40-25]HQS67660.1 toxin [Sulfuricurvum sp.]HQT36297.1 toxin [Sulfuricurvum sp.]